MGLLNLTLLALSSLYKCQPPRPTSALASRAPSTIEGGEDVVNVTFKTPGHRYDEAVSAETRERLQARAKIREQLFFAQRTHPSTSVFSLLHAKESSSIYSVEMHATRASRAACRVDYIVLVCAHPSRFHLVTHHLLSHPFSARCLPRVFFC